VLIYFGLVERSKIFYPKTEYWKKVDLKEKNPKINWDFTDN